MIQAKPLKLESPSKRLRSVIYLQWLRTEKEITSEDFYQERMEQIISKEKEKL